MLLLAALAMPALLACGSKEPPPPPEIVVATVNGERIGLGEYAKALSKEAALASPQRRLKPEEEASLKEEVVSRLVEQRIMFQRARELSLTVSEAELQARITDMKKDYGDGGFDALFVERGISYPEWKGELRKRILLEKVIGVDVNEKIQVTDQEAEAYFNGNKRVYSAAGSRVHAAQIVVRDREVAEGILKRLKANEDFAKVARETSIGPEAASGGDLGFFERGVMPEAIDRQVFSLPVGQVSRVIQSPYGFHIFKVIERQEGGVRKFAEVRQRVSADVRKLKEAEAYERWIERLKAKAIVEINSPLPDAVVPVNPEAGREAETGKH